jgi:hypothetical protein
VGRCSRESAGGNSKKKRKICLRREPRREALGEESIFAESFALNEGYFHQILFKNSKKFKISPKLNMSLDMLFIAYKKVVVHKFKMKFHDETKPSDISSNSVKLLVRCSGF